MQGVANDINFSSEGVTHYVNVFLNQIILYLKCIEENQYVISSILILHIIICISLYFALTNINRTSNGALTTKEKILFVICHPDDECMFFGPAIVNLIKNENKNVFLLCLSYGDYYQKGKLRKQELWNSCTTLGIPESNILLQRISVLPDDPNVVWNENVIFNLVINYVETLRFDAVVTFDRDGVSGHRNHKAVYYGLAYAIANQLFPQYCTVYCLDSVNKLRKFSIIFDLFFSWCFSSNLFILSPRNCHLVKKAMLAHETQYVWFRKLYIWISRYAYINTFSLLCADTASFDVNYRECS